MNEQNTKMELLGNAPVPKALLALGLPAKALLKQPCVYC